jgi:cell division protein FtsN
MPLYYRKDAPFRDEHWHHCYRCHGTDLVSQVEAWDPRRENAVNAMCTAETLPKMMQSATLLNPPTPMQQAPRSAPQQPWGQQTRPQERPQSWGQQQRREQRGSAKPQPSWPQQKSHRQQPQQASTQRPRDSQFDAPDAPELDIPW